METASRLHDFFDQSPFILLDGGMGTTLPEEGARLEAGSWSGIANLNAIDAVERVHKRFYDAGAHVLTTNTFRTAVPRIAKSFPEFNDYAASLLRDRRIPNGIAPEGDYTVALAYLATKAAVDAARAIQASSERLVFVGGSMGPVGETHKHDPLPLNYLRLHHVAHANLLARLGVDLLFPEAIPSLNEARAMAEAATSTGKPFIASFSLNKDGLLFDGTPLPEAIRATDYRGRIAVTINCTPGNIIERALDDLLTHSSGFVGAYPNGGGYPHADEIHWHHDHSSESVGQFTDAMLRWSEKDSRVKIFGGCCGASPNYIEATRSALLQRYPGQSAVEAAYNR
jgi:homocysteine S-methyltransferase